MRSVSRHYHRGSPTHVPVAQETHRRVVAGSVDDCWDALLNVTVAELPVYRTLMKIRSLGRYPLELSDSALESMPPRIVGQDPPSSLLTELSWSRPKVSIAMDFRLEPHGPETLLTTRTRVWAADGFSAALFMPYWMLIRPGSGWIRRELLNAIARRVEVAQ